MAHAGGRPTDYDPEVIPIVERMAEAGLTDLQMSKSLGIDEATFYRWKNKYVEFCEAIKRNKKNPDDQVERSLFERACGFEHPSEEVFCKDGEITRAEIIKKYPPDPTAAIFWLKNRRPEKWRDQVEQIHKFPDGLIIRSSDGKEVERMTVEEVQGEKT